MRRTEVRCLVNAACQYAAAARHLTAIVDGRDGRDRRWRIERAQDRLVAAEAALFAAALALADAVPGGVAGGQPPDEAAVILGSGRPPGRGAPQG